MQCSRDPRTDAGEIRNAHQSTRAYCTEKGYIYIDQLGVREIGHFYGSWKDGKKEKAKEFELLKNLVLFA